MAKLEQTEEIKSWMVLGSRDKSALMTLPQLLKVIEHTWKQGFDDLVRDKGLVQDARLLAHLRNTICHMSTISAEEKDHLKRCAIGSGSWRRRYLIAIREAAARFRCAQPILHFAEPRPPANRNPIPAAEITTDASRRTSAALFSQGPMVSARPHVAERRAPLAKNPAPAAVDRSPRATPARGSRRPHA